MIRVIEAHDVVAGQVRYYVYAGTNNDTKPTAGVSTGSKFVEVDTGDVYMFDEASGNWNKMSSGGGGGGGGERVIIETEFYKGSSIYERGFVSILDADVIAGYFKSGKSIIFHLPDTEYSSAYGFDSDVYVQAVEYTDEYEAGERGMVFRISTSVSGDEYNAPAAGYSITSIQKNENDKLYLKLYID